MLVYPCRTMPKRLHLQPYLSTDDLERRYRGAHDPVLRSHYQIIWLLSQGRLTREVTAITGYSANWVRELAHRYNREGSAGLGDRRAANPGQAPLLDPVQQAALHQALTAQPPGGGQWTGPKVATWMSQRLGRPIASQRGWEYLRKLGYTPQVPRPAHIQADPAAQAAFKQTCPSG